MSLHRSDSRSRAAPNRVPAGASRCSSAFPWTSNPSPDTASNRKRTAGSRGSSSPCQTASSRSHFETNPSPRRAPKRCDRRRRLEWWMEQSRLVILILANLDYATLTPRRLFLFKPESGDGEAARAKFHPPVSSRGTIDSTLAIFESFEHYGRFLTDGSRCIFFYFNSL